MLRAMLIALSRRVNKKQLLSSTPIYLGAIILFYIAEGQGVHLDLIFP